MQWSSAIFLVGIVDVHLLRLHAELHRVEGPRLDGPDEAHRHAGHDGALMNRLGPRRGALAGHRKCVQMYKCAKVRKDTKKSVQKCVKSEKNLEKKQKLPQNMRKMAPKFKEFMKMCGKIIFRKKIEGDKIKKCKKNAIMGKEWDNGQKNWDWGNHKKKKNSQKCE